MDSPRGRIYLMRAAAEEGRGPTEAFGRPMDLWLGCRACESACPGGVPSGALLEPTRFERAGRGLSSERRLLTRLIFAVFPHPGRMGLLLGAFRLYQRSGLQRLVRASGLLRLAPRLAAMEALLPLVPPREPLPELIPARGGRRGRLGLLTGCVQRHLYPQVNRDTARLLSLAGWDVIVPREQGCCGALDLHGGRLGAFRRRARALAAQFAGDLDYVVTSAAGCGSALKEYRHWPPQAAQVGALAPRVRDVSQVLVDADLPLGRLQTSGTNPDALCLLSGQKPKTKPRPPRARTPRLG